MSKSHDRKPASQTVFSRLFDRSRANLYLSPANVLAALIAGAATIEVIKNFIHVNQLKIGVIAIPFIACLDILFIAIAASLFVRRPSGSITYLGFIAILVVPNVGSIVVTDVMGGLSGVNGIPDQATRRLIESSIILVLSLLYFWDIVNRMREAKESKATS